MKKEPLIVFSVLLMILTAFTGVYSSVEAKSNHSNEIFKKADVTGDGVKDEVVLKKVKLNHKKNIEHHFIITAKLSNGKTHSVKVMDGQNPKLSLVDLDHNGVKDVFIQSYLGGSNNEYRLFSFKDFIFEELKIPEMPTIQGQFVNDYRAMIGIQETKMDYTFKLKTRKQKYDTLGIYHNGIVNEPTELVIEPYGGFNPVKYTEGEFGLKGIQRISGIDKTDPIALVESYFSLLDGKWTMKKVMVVEVNR